MVWVHCALVDGVRPDSEGVARAAGHPLALGLALAPAPAAVGRAGMRGTRNFCPKPNLVL